MRVQLGCTAVSYPGVGRFRRAETGILGVEQIRGLERAPFLFGSTFRSRQGMASAMPREESKDGPSGPEVHPSAADCGARRSRDGTTTLRASVQKVVP